MGAGEGEPASHVFGSDRLWQQPSLFGAAETEAYESTLFAPLQLDSKSRSFLVVK